MSETGYVQSVDVAQTPDTRSMRYYPRIMQLFEETTKLLNQGECHVHGTISVNAECIKIEAMITTLQQQYQTTQLRPTELDQLIQKMQELQKSLVPITNDLFATAQTIARNVKIYLSQVDGCHKESQAFLKQWREQQKRAQYGVNSDTDLLSGATHRLQEIMLHSLQAINLLRRFSALQQQAKTQLCTDSDFSILWCGARRLAFEVLRTGFVVTYQPPLVVKNKIKLEVSLLSAVGQLGLDTQGLTVKTQVISEETAAAVKANPALIIRESDTVGSIGNAAKHKLTQLRAVCFGFDIPNVKVSVNSRKESTKNGDAITKKYYLLFTSNVSFGGEQLKICTMSLPFMVSVHGTQDVDLYPKAFWDMAFSDSDVPTKIKTEMRWSELEPLIDGIFSTLTQSRRRLSHTDLQYLRYRLFNDQVPEQNPLISWQQFSKEKLFYIGTYSPCAFSFWEWFFHIIDMIQKKSGRHTGVREMWEERMIQGFITKNDADCMLLQCAKPAMLLRFSDNYLAAISVVHTNTKTNRVDHLNPFKFKDEIEKLTLPGAIINCAEIRDVQVIYPSLPISKVTDVYKQCMANKKSDEVPPIGGYEKRTIIITSDPNKGSQLDPAMSPDSAAFYNAVSPSLSTANISPSSYTTSNQFDGIYHSPRSSDECYSNSAPSTSALAIYELQSEARAEDIMPMSETLSNEDIFIPSFIQAFGYNQTPDSTSFGSDQQMDLDFMNYKY